jgi:outer membrane protein, heavy metal efflux system
MLERAKMEYLPDFNVMAGFTGSMTQFIGATLVLPTELPKIRATIEESRADLRRVQAMRDQEHANTAAEYVAQIAALRDAERQIGFFEKSILPLAEQAISLSRQSYSAGSSGYLDLIDTQRTLLDVRLTLAEARALREKTLAEIERLAGADLETTSTPTTQEIK